MESFGCTARGKFAGQHVDGLRTSSAPRRSSQAIAVCRNGRSSVCDELLCVPRGKPFRCDLSRGSQYHLRVADVDGGSPENQIVVGKALRTHGFGVGVHAAREDGRLEQRCHVRRSTHEFPRQRLKRLSGSPTRRNGPP